MIHPFALAIFSILSILTLRVLALPMKAVSSTDYIFDFLNASADAITQGQGGRTVVADINTFPMLLGHGVAMTLGFIEPCGMNLPHVHPRASEINYIVEGAFTVGFIEDNKSPVVINEVTKGKATFFPQGAIHFEQNLNCEKAVFVAAFNNEHPGVNTVINNAFKFPEDVVGAALGGRDISFVEDLKKSIPSNPALGIEECRKRCGL